jgi:TolB-like protein/DNA-binding SARP family transcriptional activator
MPDLRLSLLGGLEIVGDAAGRSLTRKARGMLAYLALHPRHAQSREKLAALFWGRAPDSQARTNLRQTLSGLRRALACGNGAHLLTEGDQVSLDPNGLVLDVTRFEELIARSTPEDQEQAIALYKGDLLEGFSLNEEPFEEWVRSERERLRAMAVAALEMLVSHYFDAQDFARCIPAATRLLALDPLRENIHRALMRAYAAQGRPSLSLKQYDVCRNALQRELGVQPESETAQLYAWIRRQRSVPVPIDGARGRPDTEAEGDRSARRPGFPNAGRTVQAPPARQRLGAMAPKSTTDTPSVAVLPFVNMSGDPAQDYFSDGVTDDIITELSRFRNLFVIARNSSFAYRDKGLTIQQIARALGVQHIVEGSIRITASRVRVVAQLIDAATGRHLWAERYDRDLSDIFAVQDEVTRSIVAILAVRLEGEGAARAQRKPPENMEAYDYWLRGKKCMEWFTPERNSEACRHFEQAIALDTRYARGYAGLALVDRWSVWYTRSYTPEHHADETARRYALKAVELDDADHIPHVILAWAHIWQRDFEEARHELERALALNPNDADLLAESCGAWKYLGEPEAAIAAGNLALRLNPLHPPWYLGYLASAYLMARRHDEAIAVGARAPDAWPETCGMLTAACAHANRLDDARHYATRWVGVIRSRFTDAQEVTPRDCAQWILHFNLFKRQSDFDHLAAGLRKAGLVE